VLLPNQRFQPTPLRVDEIPGISVEHGEWVCRDDATENKNELDEIYRVG
jgi:hypothetical protein